MVSSNPFAIIEPSLRQLERELSQVIDDYDKCVSTKHWPRYFAHEARVRAVERSIRRQHKVYHCVFGGGQSCRERTISNCDACASKDGTPVKLTKQFIGRAKDGSLWTVETTDI